MSNINDVPVELKTEKLNLPFLVNSVNHYFIRNYFFDKISVFNLSSISIEVFYTVKERNK